MRMRYLLIPMLGLLATRPAPMPAQGITIRFGARLGPELNVFAYTRDRMGDWRTNYRKWTPVTVYDVNGHYYRYRVAGSRPVMMYEYQGNYFLPPQEPGWNDRRFNARYRPNDDDFRRGRPWSDNDRWDPRLGAEIGVFAYTPARAGDWHRNWRTWTPVMVYEKNGHYYSRNAPGTRAVMVYRYQNEYFLPPDDPSWVGADRRFDRRHMPNDMDRRSVRTVP